MKKIVVEVQPRTRAPTVLPNKIVLPRKLPREESLVSVEYRVPRTETLIGAVAMLSILATILIPIHPLAPAALLSIAALLLHLDSRRRSRIESALSRNLPREKVVEIVEKFVEICSEATQPEVELEHGDTKLVFRCGVPTKCLEYDQKELKKIAAVVVPIAMLFLVTQSVSPYASVFVGLPAFAILVAMGRKPICRRYEIEKVRIVTE